MIGIYDLCDCTNLSYRERLYIYKEVGFSEIALYIDERYNRPGESYVDIISYAKEIGLEIRQVHIDYKISNLICDETTSAYFDYVSKKLREAKSLGIKCVVAHASMSDTPPFLNETQTDKFVQMMKSLKSQNVILCLENVRNNHNLDVLLSLNLDNVKMCFDLGHAHAYGDEKTLFETHKKYVICSHLHNNFGKDTHQVLCDGEIDYKFFLQNLSNSDIFSNCLECFPERGKILDKKEFQDFVKKCFDSIR